MEIHLTVGLLSILLYAQLISGGGNSANVGDRDTTQTNQGYKVTSDKPFVFTSIVFEPYLMENPDKEATGNDQFIGFIPDLVKELASRLNIEYELKLVDDHRWGSRDQESGKWNGMIGEVINGVAIMAVAPITKTPVRNTVVKFSSNFQNITLSALVKADTDYNSFEDLIADKDVTLGYMRGGNTEDKLQHSRDPTIQKLWPRMQVKDAHTDTIEDGKDKVLRGNFSFFLESPIAEFHESQDCDLRAVSSSLLPSGYGFAIKDKETEFLQNVNDALQEMQEDGRLEEIQNLYWTDRETCSGCHIVASFVLVLLSIMMVLGL